MFPLMIIPPCFLLKIYFPPSHLGKTCSQTLISKSPVYGIFKGIAIIFLALSLLSEHCFLVILILILQKLILSRRRRRPNANRLKFCWQNFKTWKRNLDTSTFYVFSHRLGNPFYLQVLLLSVSLL